MFLTLAALAVCEEDLPLQSGSAHLFDSTSVAVCVSSALLTDDIYKFNVAVTYLS